MPLTPVLRAIDSIQTDHGQAVRFLQRATFGPGPGDVAELQDLGTAAWFDEQYSLSTGEGHYERMQDPAERLQTAVWAGILGGQGQLRRRVAYALSQIFVVSDRQVYHMEVAAFADLLMARALGDFRALLEAVTLSPAMSNYLSMNRNSRANPATGTAPDENFAREVMQLFTIGLWQLDTDGKQLLENGQPIPTYAQEDVNGLARVFTGWTSGGGDDRFRSPLEPWEPTERWHEPGEKQFLGVAIPVDTPVRESLRIALDTLANHPNVGPFIGRQLIQRLVTSNPSAAYVRRVAEVFNDDGTGSRGNLFAVVKVILTDPEALDPAPPETFGKLREPVLRFTTVARALGVSSAVQRWPIGRLDSGATGLGQQPYYSSSVFNFYRPGYVPPGTSLGELALKAPELQISNETTAIGWINFLARFLYAPPGGVTFQIADLLSVADSPSQLVSAVESLLCPGRLSAALATKVTSAVQNVVSWNVDVQQRRRTTAAALLIAASTDFLYER
jgi:uncharacterized protein (DUF1800 family)